MSAVIVAITLPMLLAVGALALDVTHLYLSRKELQNAADACALAAARVLYDDEGTEILITANHAGYLAARGNPTNPSSAGVEVWHNGASFTDLTWPSGDNVTSNNGDIERGHWSFGRGDLPRDFTANPSVALTNLVGPTDAELDDDTDFINAVRCRTRREASEVTNFLAPVLSMFGGSFVTTLVSAEAVAVRGFAGRLEPEEVDQPLGICRDKILIDGVYQCSVGRMINSSDNNADTETGLWTNFTQGEGCGDPASDRSVSDLVEPDPNVCGTGNPEALLFGQGMSTKNGNMQDTLTALRTACWLNACVEDPADPDGDCVDIDADGDGKPDYPWKITLPVLDCETPTCNRVVGAVTVEVLWVTGTGEDPQFNDIPRSMTVRDEEGELVTYSCPVVAGQTVEQRKVCWETFATTYGLLDVGNSRVDRNDYKKKTLYFRPACEAQEPAGHTGGENFGILAQYPALVR